MLEKEGWRFWKKEDKPPSSPDCAPFECSFWNHIDGVLCKERSPNVAELKERVNATWAAMTPSFIKRVTCRLRSRLERVVAAGGVRIE